MWGAFNLMQRYRFLRDNLSKKPKIIIKDDDDVYGAAYRIRKEMISYEIETCVNADDLKKLVWSNFMNFGKRILSIKVRTSHNILQTVDRKGAMSESFPNTL